MNIIKIRLLGRADDGLHVTLDYSQFDPPDGYLSPLPPQLNLSFENWRSSYLQLEQIRQAHRIIPISVTYGSGNDESLSKQSLFEQRREVKTRLNQWLNSADNNLQNIRETLVDIAARLKNSQEETHVLLDVSDRKLRHIPWQEWKLFEEIYSQADIAIRVKGKGDKINAPVNYPKVRVLFVIGNTQGIDTQADLKIVQSLEKKGAEVEYLKQPDRDELCKNLQGNPGYHIFIFAGHSHSNEDGTFGWIELKNQDKFTMDDFRIPLKKAIEKGLQIAIFNSCDGLGLAHELAQLNLPCSIVMREPVPDSVAVNFLKSFFEEFTNNKSLFTSIRIAREQLEHSQEGTQYAGVSWLPTICVRESVSFENFTWRKLASRKFQSSKNIKLMLNGSLGFILGFGLGILLPLKLLSNAETSLKDFTPSPLGTWQYGGSTTWAPIRDKVDRKIAKEHPRFKLIYTQHQTLPPGSGTGIKMLLDGQLSFAQSSRPINNNEYDIAAKRGVRLDQIPVAIDGIALVVNPKLNIKSLTLANLKDIYTGKIKNWNQVGGENLEIVPYSRPSDSGTTGFFQENVLGNRNFGNNVVFIPETTQALQKISQTPGGIYFASAAEVVGQCQVKPLPINRHIGSAFIAPYKDEYIPPEYCRDHNRNQINYHDFQNGTYPLTRRLFVVVKQNGQVEEQVGESYAKLLLTDEGQKLIHQAGFIPLR